MKGRSLNPSGSDALALASVIAPRAAGTLTSVAEWIGMAVAAMSLALLAAVVWTVQVDYEVVAVTPGGAMVPIDQLDAKNEQSQRARLAVNPPAAQANPEPGRQAALAADPNTSIDRRATQR